MPGFSFGTDTFAFRNEIRSRHPDVTDLYANYCFVMARGLRQFFKFARFDPRAPRVSETEYLDRVHRIVSRPVSDPPLIDGQRIVLPGYANLREFSCADESVLKRGLGSRFWTLLDWTNWRIVLPVGGRHQERVANQIMDTIDAGQLSQLLLTTFPIMEVNHGVVAFAYRETPAAVDFSVWDPNDPDKPGTITFDRNARRFWASQLYDTDPQPLRVFRMRYSCLL